MRTNRFTLYTLVVLFAVTAAACGKKKAPLLAPTAAPEAEVTPPPAAPPTPAARVNEPPPVPTPAPIREDNLSANSASLDDLNRNSPLRPAFFALDSADIDGVAKAALDADAALLRQNPSWVVTVEGHCDERGTAEYNLALGDRRAAAAVTYLKSLGIPSERLKTVSYGKEFPFDPGHDDSAWAKNRRAHFVITAK
jgi:peptidoglycan-associated lipoprotein